MQCNYCNKAFFDKAEYDEHMKKEKDKVSAKTTFRSVIFHPNSVFFFFFYRFMTENFIVTIVATSASGKRHYGSI